jgi:hypothetical protein
LTWLRDEATPEALRALRNPDSKVDLRSLNLPLAQETLLRLHVSGSYVGQLSSWISYPQHKLDLEPLIAKLPYLQGALMQVYDDYLWTLTHAKGDDVLFFVDPPYLGTEPNYKSDQPTMDVVEDFVHQIRQPTIVTYHSPEHMPSLSWEKLAEVKVPILRGGGVRIRNEYVAYMHWPTKT